jgi:hypothetical protein
MRVFGRSGWAWFQCSEMGQLFCNPRPGSAFVGGGLMEGLQLPRDDAFWMTINPEIAQMALIVPQCRRRACVFRLSGG